YVPNRGRRSSQEEPTGEIGAERLAILLEHFRSIALGIDGDGNEGDLLSEIGTEPILNEGHHRSEDRTGVGASCKDESQRDHLAAEVRELHLAAILRSQGEFGSRRDLRQRLGELFRWGWLSQQQGSQRC